MFDATIRPSGPLIGAALLLAAWPADVRADDSRWQKVASQTAWAPRDSSGEVAFDGHLWIMGGWFNSYAAPPRDVWKSRDGAHWELATDNAPWKHSDLGMALAFKNRLWFLGGWYNGRLAGCKATSETWSSSDGVHWELATDQPGWTPRLAAAAIEFQGKMWVLGGTENYYFGDSDSLKNDVWSSADGVHWECVTTNAPWAPRAYHQAAVLDGKLYVMGGGNYVPQYAAFNDVWATVDGTHWERVTESAPWSPRIWFSAATYRDRMWVLGGWSNNPPQNWGDVWHSTNGRDWTAFPMEDAWKERHEHSAYVFDDKLWVVGGHAAPLSNDVWSLHLPQSFGSPSP